MTCSAFGYQDQKESKQEKGWKKEVYLDINSVRFLKTAKGNEQADAHRNDSRTSGNDEVNSSEIRRRFQKSQVHGRIEKPLQVWRKACQAQSPESEVLSPSLL